MVRILTYLAAAFFLVTVSAHAQQPSRLDDIAKRGTLRVGMTGDYLPFTYLDKAISKFRGIDVDMGGFSGQIQLFYRSPKSRAIVSTDAAPKKSPIAEKKKRSQDRKR